MPRHNPDQQNPFRRRVSWNRLKRFRRSQGRSGGEIRPPKRSMMQAPPRVDSPYSYRIVNVSGKGEGFGGSVREGTHGSSAGDMFARIRQTGTQIGWVITHRNESDESLNHVEAYPLESGKEFKEALTADDNASAAEIWKTPDLKIHHIPVDPSEVHVT